MEPRAAWVKLEQRSETELCVVTKVFSQRDRWMHGVICALRYRQAQMSLHPGPSLAPQTSGIQHSFHESPRSSRACGGLTVLRFNLKVEL